MEEKNGIHRHNYLIGELNAVYHDIAFRFGLSDSTMLVLYVIYENGGSCLLHDICYGSGMTKQTINSALRKLEKDGLVYLKAYDKKQKTACLTKQGEEFAGKTVGKLLEAEDSVFAAWTKEEQRTYLELIKDFTEKLKEAMKS